MTSVTAAQVADMLNVMRSKIGDGYTENIPERFGTTTPQEFDCSGLVWYASNQAGIPMPGGPSDDVAALAPYEIEWAAGLTGVVVFDDLSKIQEGDLLGFRGGDPAPFNITVGGFTIIGPGHIGMAVNSTEYVSAYDTEFGVCIKPINGTDGFLVAVRMVTGTPTPPVTPPAPADGVSAIVTWEGDDGLSSRKTTFSKSVWDDLKLGDAT